MTYPGLTVHRAPPGGKCRVTASGETAAEHTSASLRYSYDASGTQRPPYGFVEDRQGELFPGKSAGRLGPLQIAGPQRLANVACDLFRGAVPRQTHSAGLIEQFTDPAHARGKRWHALRRSLAHDERVTVRMRRQHEQIRLRINLRQLRRVGEAGNEPHTSGQREAAHYRIV